MCFHWTSFKTLLLRLDFVLLFGSKHLLTFSPVILPLVIFPFRRRNIDGSAGFEWGCFFTGRHCNQQWKHYSYYYYNLSYNCRINTSIAVHFGKGFLFSWPLTSQLSNNCTRSSVLTLSRPRELKCDMSSGKWRGEFIRHDFWWPEI